MLSMYSHNRDVLYPQKNILCRDKNSKSQDTQLQFAAESEKTQLWIFFQASVVAFSRYQKLWDVIKDSEML